MEKKEIGQTLMYRSYLLSAADVRLGEGPILSIKTLPQAPEWRLNDKIQARY